MATTLQPASATSRMAATKTSRSAPIHGGPAHLALDAEQPVVLGDTLRPRGCPGLELATVDGDHEVGDEGVLGLPAAVADHRVVAVGTSEDVPCVVCEKTPCEYQGGGEPVCSFEHGLKILCGPIASIRPLSDY